MEYEKDGTAEFVILVSNLLTTIEFFSTKPPSSPARIPFLVC